MRRSLALLCITAALFLARPPDRSAAEGLIVAATRAGDSGPQLDATLLSPRPLPVPGGGDVAGTYVVEQGDTLAAIAARLNVGAAVLASASGLSDPDRIIAGQVLRVPGTGAVSASPLDSKVLRRLQVWPWPPSQGQTIVVWLHAVQPISMSLTFEEKPYPVVQSGKTGWALIPLPPLIAPGARVLRVAAGEHEYRLQVPVREGTFPTINIPGSASDAILSDASKVQSELQRVTTVFAGDSPGGWDSRSRFRAPLAGEYGHSAPYGQRRTYGASPALSAHAGEDFPAAEGTPVLAPAPGRVVLAAPLFVRGNAVIVDHGRGVLSGYWHLSQIAVTEGDDLSAGQVLGKVGTTGLSTGAHLHWELRIRGMAVDPMQWLAP